MLRVCEHELRLRNVVQHEYTQCRILCAVSSCPGALRAAAARQMLRTCERELRLRNVVQHEMTPDGTTWADVAATTADGTRVAIVHIKYYNRLRGPDGCARYADARGLLATTTARIRVLAWEGYRVRPGTSGFDV